MTYEENETTIVFDYAGETVQFFTTRRGERDNLVKRVGADNIISEKENGDGDSWLIVAHIKAFRNPYMVSRVIKN